MSTIVYAVILFLVQLFIHSGTVNKVLKWKDWYKAIAPVGAIIAAVMDIVSTISSYTEEVEASLPALIIIIVIEYAIMEMFLLLCAFAARHLKAQA